MLAISQPNVETPKKHIFILSVNPTYFVIGCDVRQQMPQYHLHNVPGTLLKRINKMHPLIPALNLCNKIEIRMFAVCSLPCSLRPPIFVIILIIAAIPLPGLALE